jgi:cyclophilin family peptidyl-prolyl cis-trans isomerase
MKTALILFSILFLGCSFGSFNTTKVKNLVEIDTKFGKMVVYLYDATPKHKENFLKLADTKFYDSTTFHRVIKNFMIQGGDPNSKDTDPNNDGQGGPGYEIPAEFNPKIQHKYGALAAARQGDQVNPEKKSSGSQFYIVVNPKGTHFLDNNYTVFGEVISGMDVAEKIVAVPTDGANNRPYSDVKMSMKVIKTMSIDVSQLQIM